MPFLLPALPAIAGIGGSLLGGLFGGSGNSGQSAADQQAAIQKQQLDFGKQVFSTGMTAWQPAADYWSSLLSGDATKMAGAVSPTANLIRNNTATTGTSISNLLPQGGEKNLAQATNLISGANQLGQLTAGVQPTAATALGQLSGIPIGAGTGIMGQAAPNVSAALKFDRNAQQQKASTGGALGTSLGSILYNAINRKSSGGGGGGGSNSSGIPGWPTD